MVNKRKQINFNFYTIALILITILASMFSAYPLLASADGIAYTNVLEDLKKDESFNVENYPVDQINYSLQVIQIAESENNELFVYVYQPEANIARLATCINMSIDKNGLEPALYNLDYINSTDTLFKYKVQNFTIVDEYIRVYDIISIYREFDEYVDKGLSDDNDNMIDEVSFPVAKVWTAQDYEGEVIYTCLDTEVIQITDKYAGFVRYPDGWGPLKESCDSHFVAFSTDREIDRLLEAEVYYASQTYKETYTPSISIGLGTTNKQFGDIISDNYVELNYTEKFTYTADGWFGYYNTYSWDRIQTVAQFFETTNTSYIFNLGLFNISVDTYLTADARANIENKQWVLRFAETDFTRQTYTNGGYSIDKTIVGEVSILRLKFETNGLVYNLGVVDNKQTGADTPVNGNSSKPSIPWWVWVIIAISIIFVIRILFPNFINTCVGGLFKGIWWLITAPLEIFKKDGE